MLIAFDAFTIVERYPNPSQDPARPTPVDPALIHLTTQQDGVIGQSAHRLCVRADPGDVIRWRETTLSLGFDYSVLLYKYVVRTDRKLISDLQPVIVDALLPLPVSETDHEFETQAVLGHYWAAHVQRSGSDRYKFFFQLLSGKNRLGFFRWDPQITIRRRS
ncbi:hypothetical protein M878_43815 [Streptomyces roseochromogenus subsp. oscitans DS 12.976]|uniref:Inclusion body protein n=1 Tax=Streptomyces roseochromogenus subsp. oscitans DS 12.976 TaxID=1352936 RepID=V6JG73_STRRC|nr:hypothetical protein M878_43815 [Streptomyces roseochromogenus subsp. oscitans DS 12.976]